MPPCTVAHTGSIEAGDNDGGRSKRNGGPLLEIDIKTRRGARFPVQRCSTGKNIATLFWVRNYYFMGLKIRRELRGVAPALCWPCCPYYPPGAKEPARDFRRPTPVKHDVGPAPIQAVTPPRPPPPQNPCYHAAAPHASNSASLSTGQNVVPHAVKIYPRHQ